MSWESLSSGGLLTGTPTTASMDLLTVRASDAIGENAQQFFSIMASSTLILTTASLPTATVGVAYSAPLTVAGGSGLGYACTIVSATPNTGKWLACTGMALTGTAQMNEIETVTLVATDSAGNISAPVTLSLTVNVTGSLSIVSATYPGAVVNGMYAAQILCQGGAPPYAWNWPASQPNQITLDGWMLSTPTATGTISYSGASVTDSYGTTLSYNPSITVNSALFVFAGYDTVQSFINLPPAIAGQKYSHQLIAYGGTGSGRTYTVASGALPAGLSLSSAGLITGTPTRGGNVLCQLKCVDSGSNSTGNINALMPVALAAQVSRPSYNSSVSNGFFVLNGKLYDPNGYEFRPRGVDRVHYDSISWASNTNGALSGANICREFANNFSGTGTQLATHATTEYTSNGIVDIFTMSSVQSQFTGSIDSAGTVLTVSSINAVSTTNGGKIFVGPSTGDGQVSLSGVTGGVILSQLSGTSGGTGTYSVSGATANASGAMTCSVGTSGCSDNNVIPASTAVLNACTQRTLIAQ